MPTPKSPFDDQNDPPSLGDRTLDKWMGLDKLDSLSIDLPPQLSAPAGKEWDARRHRESTVWSRMLRGLLARAGRPGFWSSEPGADPANHWTEYLAGFLGWSAIAAVVVALLYLVWYGLTFFQIL
jgi:hypothetical protein